jgi:hypothetical protein
MQNAESSDILHSAFSLLHLKTGELPRTCRLKSRDFTVKVCSPKKGQPDAGAPACFD